MARYTLLTLLLNAVAASAQNNFIYEPSTTSYEPAFWTVTTRLIDVYSTTLYTYRNSLVTTQSYQETRTIKSDVTPTATPTFTSTYTGYYSEVDTVYLYYSTGAVAESDLVPEYDVLSSTSRGARTIYDFSMAVTITAPSTCSSKFTITSVASVSVPSQVRSLVTPTSVATGRTISNRYGEVTVSQTWYLSDGSAPYRTADDDNYMYYVKSCRTPPIAFKTASATSTSSPYDGDSSPGDSRYSNPDCYWSSYACMISWVTIVIIVVSIVVGLFLLGILESWLWFRRLMLGKSAMRFGTVCWILVSLWVLCATRMQDRRSAEDQELLATRWKEMKTGTKLKAWMKYGLRHRYPEEYLGQFSKMTVGIVPPGEPLHPAMSQIPISFLPGGQVYYAGAQPALGPNGQLIPPQGYTVPPGQHVGFYGDEMTKAGVAAGSSPAAPQPPIAAPSLLSHGPPPTPPPKEAVPDLPPQASTPLPPASESTHNAPMHDVPTKDTSTADAPTKDAPQLPPIEVSEQTVTSEPQVHDETSNPKPPNPKRDPDNRSLYE